MLDVLPVDASAKLKVGALDDIVAAVLDMMKLGLSMSIMNETHNLLNHF